MESTTPTPAILAQIRQKLETGRKALSTYRHPEVLLETRLRSLTEFRPCMISSDHQTSMAELTSRAARELHARTQEQEIRITTPTSKVDRFKWYGNMALEMAIRMEEVTNEFTTKLDTTEAELKTEYDLGFSRKGLIPDGVLGDWTTVMAHVRKTWMLIIALHQEINECFPEDTRFLSIGQ
ncbi:MAG: hypothetical protein Q9187_007013 [Circinaria calcarea]